MALIDLHPEFAELTSELSSQEIDRYDIEVDGQAYTIVVGGPDDFRVHEAKQIEIDTFVELGDKPEEVAEEFLPYDASTVFLFIHKTHDTPELTDRSPLLGMGRFIPYTDEKGLKTFTDLAEIATSTPLEDVRSSILGTVGLADCIDRKDDQECSPESINARIEELFAERYGATDLTKVLDIATLAPDMSLPPMEKFKVIDALLRGMAIYTTDMHREDKLTHLVQFTAVKFHALLKMGGYPVHELFDLEGLSYDSFGNGEEEENMVATPSVLKTEELQDVFFAEVPVTDFMVGVSQTLRDHYAKQD